MKNISKKESSREQLSLAAKAAWLAYIGGYTQSQVADKLQISSAKAHRLIALAHDHNMVKIFIEGEIVECVELEEQILEQFKLNNCIVVPDMDNEHHEFQAVGAAGADFLYKLLKKSHSAVIGIGKGRTLKSMVDQLPRFHGQDLQFVSVSGGLTRKFSTNPYDVIHRLSEISQSEAYFLPVPYMAKDQNEKNVLLSQQSVKHMLAFAKTADVFVLGLGSMNDNAHVLQTGLIENSIWQKMSDANAVGDFMGTFLDEQGEKISDPLNDLALGLSLEDIKGKRVIAIIGGDDKGAATQAALKTSTITDLIIGEQSARQLIKLKQSGDIT